jgi:lysine 6-dehydrogenase
MMGRAITHDLVTFSQFENITVADSNQQLLKATKTAFQEEAVEVTRLDVNDTHHVQQLFQNVDVVISAIPYIFNYTLTKTAIETQTHFLDLGGNNNIVNKQRALTEEAKNQDVTIMPDCGLAPGLVSIITKDIVEQLDEVDFVNLRVGGLPLNPKPPLNYQIVFSPNGLINEYVEPALILDHGKIIEKNSMTDLESLSFSERFPHMEAFLTSGGCSTLPYTYQKKIGYLDYKTIRYPSHCERFRTLLQMGLAETDPINVKGTSVVPRDVLVTLLESILPTCEKDVVLLKVIGEGKQQGKQCYIEYILVDYYDDLHNITAMMRTTGYPVSILAQMIENGTITKRGVFCCEELVPCQLFFDELEKRNIVIEKQIICK